MFHIRKLAVYFAVLVAWRAGVVLMDGFGAVEAIRQAGVLGALGLVAIGVLYAVARGVARTTIYTITSKRVVMRFGIAFPMTYNLPFKAVESAAVKAWADGSGDLSIRLLPDVKMSWAILWPHARPWRVGRPEPALRGLAEVSAVAAILGKAVAASEPVSVASEAPARPAPTGALSPAHG